MPYNEGMSGGRPTTRKAPPFGERLAALRTQNGLSQSQFAKKAGISRQMVEYYERRATNPTTGFLQKAALVLGVPSDELLGIKPLPKPKPGPKSKVEQKLEAVKNLPRTEQQFVIKFLDKVLAESS